MNKTFSTSLDYEYQVAKKVRLLIVMVAILVLSIIMDVMAGPGNFSLKDIFTVIWSPDTAPLNSKIIILDIRLPVALMAVIVGAMLSVAGAQMQTILNNPLAEPFTLGISSAASFGAALAIVLGESFKLFNAFSVDILVTIFSFIFALLTSALLFFFTRMRNAGVETMVLLGIAMLFTFNALLSLLQYTATDAQLSQIVFWMMGSLTRANWDKLLICTLVLTLVLPIFIWRSWSLTALRMGDDKAQSLGVNVNRLRIEIMILVSLLAATAVSFVGTIAFVGLVGPHIARMLVGEDQRYFLPMSLLCGALMLSLTSLVSKSITPGVIYPVGIITSLIGIPFFVGLLMRVRQRSWQ